jgi:hypothetical protein
LVKAGPRGIEWYRVNYIIMNIKFTKKQYQELVTLTAVGSYIQGALNDLYGKPYKEDILLEHLLSYAEGAGLPECVENFEGHLLLSDTLSEKVDQMMEEYNDDEFWFQLSHYLGKRDFYQSLTPQEKEAIEKDKHGWLPNRVHDFYALYEQEFLDYGVSRLVIKKTTDKQQ